MGTSTEVLSPFPGPQSIRNVIILGISFLLLMASYIPMAGITQTIMESMHKDDPSFTGDGYISLSLTNIFFSVSNFIAPMIVGLCGVRTTLIVGSTSYAIFTASFFFPNKWLIYATSSFVGFAAASVWVANGKYFTKCSTKETIGRNMGIYWGIFAMGQLSGNAFIFWRFQGKTSIDLETRTVVIAMLTGIAVLSTITMFFLGVPRNGEADVEDPKAKEKTKSEKSFCKSLLEPFLLLGHKNMLLLIPSSMYNGIQLAFYMGIYPTAVGFTEAFGEDSRKLSGLSGILVGAGTVVGGSVFGIFGKKIVKNKRHFIVTIAFLAHCVCSALMYMNLPNDSSLRANSEISRFNPPSIPIVIVTAFLFGLGDGCINPQIQASLGVVWPDDPSAAFSIFRFVQAASTAGAFYLSTLTGLYNQIIIFMAVAVIGTITFWVNERLIEKMEKGVVKIEVGSTTDEFQYKEGDSVKGILGSKMVHVE